MSKLNIIIKSIKFSVEIMEHDWSGVPLDDLARLLSLATKDNNNIVSVGCGTGKYEQYMKSKYLLKEMNWILVDPNQKSYDKSEVVIRSDFENCEKLVKSKPELIKNCVLLLIWPSPNNSDYDYQAVQLLKPCEIISMWELPPGEDYGSSMGITLSRFLLKKNDSIYGLQDQKLYMSKGYSCELINMYMSMLKTLGLDSNPKNINEAFGSSKMYPRISWHSFNKKNAKNIDTNVTTLSIKSHAWVPKQ